MVVFFQWSIASDCHVPTAEITGGKTTTPFLSKSTSQLTNSSWSQGKDIKSIVKHKTTLRCPCSAALLTQKHWLSLTFAETQGAGGRGSRISRSYQGAEGNSSPSHMECHQHSASSGRQGIRRITIPFCTPAREKPRVSNDRALRFFLFWFVFLEFFFFFAFKSGQADCPQRAPFQPAQAARYVYLVANWVLQNASTKTCLFTQD